MQEPDALIDVYDRNGNVYSIKQRSEIDKKKDILRCVVVLILNPKNELFLVRARDSTFPGKFGCSAAGLVRHRENPIEAVERTMKRELGVAIPLHSLGEKFYEFYETEGIKRYMRVYYGTVEEGTLEPNMNDIESYEWVPFNDVEKRFSECMPTLKEAYKEMKKALPRSVRMGTMRNRNESSGIARYPKTTLGGSASEKRFRTEPAAR